MKLARLLGVSTLMVLAVAFLVGAERGNDTTSLQGKPAPQFSLQTVGGKEMSLAGEKGNVVVLDFWATWCPPCRASLPHLQAIHEDKDLAGKGLKVYAVNLREDKAKAKDYAEQNHLTFPIPLDKAGAVAQKYLVRGIPTTVVVGRDGKVAKAFIGFGKDSEEKLRDAITAALDAPKPSGSATTKPAAKE
jgi:thiol-disulfide isomerase/thioredoxin